MGLFNRSNSDDYSDYGTPERIRDAIKEYHNNEESYYLKRRVSFRRKDFETYNNSWTYKRLVNKFLKAFISGRYSSETAHLVDMRGILENEYGHLQMLAQNAEIFDEYKKLALQSLENRHDEDTVYYIKSFTTIADEDQNVAALWKESFLQFVEAYTKNQKDMPNYFNRYISLMANPYTIKQTMNDIEIREASNKLVKHSRQLLKAEKTSHKYEIDLAMMLLLGYAEHKDHRSNQQVYSVPPQEVQKTLDWLLDDVVINIDPKLVIPDDKVKYVAALLMFLADNKDLEKTILSSRADDSKQKLLQSLSNLDFQSYIEHETGGQEFGESVVRFITSETAVDEKTGNVPQIINDIKYSLYDAMKTAVEKDTLAVKTSTLFNSFFTNKQYMEKVLSNPDTRRTYAELLEPVLLYDYKHSGAGSMFENFAKTYIPMNSLYINLINKSIPDNKRSEIEGEFQAYYGIMFDIFKSLPEVDHDNAKSYGFNLLSDNYDDFIAKNGNPPQIIEDRTIKALRYSSENKDEEKISFGVFSKAFVYDRFDASSWKNKLILEALEDTTQNIIHNFKDYDEETSVAAKNYLVRIVLGNGKISNVNNSDQMHEAFYEWPNVQRLIIDAMLGDDLVNDHFTSDEGYSLMISTLRSIAKNSEGYLNGDSSQMYIDIFKQIAEKALTGHEKAVDIMRALAHENGFLQNISDNIALNRVMLKNFEALNFYGSAQQSAPLLQGNIETPQSDYTAPSKDVKELQESVSQLQETITNLTAQLKDNKAVFDTDKKPDEQEKPKQKQKEDYELTGYNIVETARVIFSDFAMGTITEKKTQDEIWLSGEWCLPLKDNFVLSRLEDDYWDNFSPEDYNQFSGFIRFYHPDELETRLHSSLYVSADLLRVDGGLEFAKSIQHNIRLAKQKNKAYSLDNLSTSYDTTVYAFTDFYYDKVTQEKHLEDLLGDHITFRFKKEDSGYAHLFSTIFNKSILKNSLYHSNVIERQDDCIVEMPIDVLTQERLTKTESIRHRMYKMQSEMQTLLNKEGVHATYSGNVIDGFVDTKENGVFSKSNVQDRLKEIAQTIGQDSSINDLVL